MGCRRAGKDADFPGGAADAPSLDGWRTWGAAPVPTAQRCSPDGPGPRFGAGFAVSLDPLRSPLCSHRTRPARWAFFRGQEEGSRYVDAFLNSLNDIIWSMALVGLCLGLGLYFSIRTRFMQVWGVPEMLRLMFRIGRASCRGRLGTYG